MPARESGNGEREPEKDLGGDPGSGPHGAAAAFRVFAILWAVFHLMELLIWPVWLLAGWGWGVFFTASAVLFRPDSVRRLVFLVVASVAKTFHEMPFVPNHVLFAWYLNLTIIAALIVLRFRGRGAVCGGAWISLFAPLLRAQVVALYLLSALQKMNRDYLDAELSCASVIFREIADDLRVIPQWDWLASASTYTSIAVEILIPLLLLISRTRLLGLLIGIAFHGFLGFHFGLGVHGFTFLMFTLFTLFLPARVVERLAVASSWPSLRPLRIGTGRALALLFAIWVFGVIRSQVWLYLNIGRELYVYHAAYIMAQGFWLVLTLWLVAGLGVVLWRFGASGQLISRAGALPTAVAAMLIVGTAALPWIGSKTQTSFSMFSNLRTEFGENHLFLRRLHWIGAQDDMVEVLSSKPDVFDPAVNPGSGQQYANTGTIMPMFELRRLAHQIGGELEVEFMRDGEKHTAVRDAGGNISGVAEVFDAPGFLARKFLWFRRHETTTGCMHCTH